MIRSQADIKLSYRQVGHPPGRWTVRKSTPAMPRRDAKVCRGCEPGRRTSSRDAVPSRTSAGLGTLLGGGGLQERGRAGFCDISIGVRLPGEGCPPGLHHEFRPLVRLGNGRELSELLGPPRRSLADLPASCSGCPITHASADGRWPAPLVSGSSAPPAPAARRGREGPPRCPP